MIYSLIDLHQRGNILMATDWFILDKGIPALHTFTWNPPSISIGYLQTLKGLNINVIKDYQLSIVRRPTGGKAVIHIGDISIALFLPSTILPKRAKDSYVVLSELLKEALEILSNISLTRTTSDNYHEHEGCFSSSTGYELGIDNQKVVGIAVRKTKKGMLMHASIRMKALPSFASNLFDPPETQKGTFFEYYDIFFTPQQLHNTLLRLIGNKYALKPIPLFLSLETLHRNGYINSSTVTY